MPRTESSGSAGPRPIIEGLELSAAAEWFGQVAEGASPAEPEYSVPCWELQSPPYIARLVVGHLRGELANAENLLLDPEIKAIRKFNRYPEDLERAPEVDAPVRAKRPRKGDLDNRKTATRGKLPRIDGSIYPQHVIEAVRRTCRALADASKADSSTFIASLRVAWSMYGLGRMRLILDAALKEATWQLGVEAERNRKEISRTPKGDAVMMKRFLEKALKENAARDKSEQYTKLEVANWVAQEGRFGIGGAQLLRRVAALRRAERHDIPVKRRDR